MMHFLVVLLALPAVAFASAQSPPSTTPSANPEPAAKVVAYWEAISTGAPVDIDYVPTEHLELREAAVAQPAAVQPAAGAAAGAAGAVAQPAAVQPAAGQPAAGVGGAGAVPAAALPTNGGQVSPVTTINVFTVVGGVTKQVPIAYTQKFSSVPSQGPTPLKGEIGLGTLTGKIGVVKTAEAKKGSAGRSVATGLGEVAVLITGMFAVMI